MPVKIDDREYRMCGSFEIVEKRTEDTQNGTQNDESYIVEGYASTFERYSLGKDWEGNDVFEQIDPAAFLEADMSDVIMQYDHEGRVFARNKNGTLQLSVDNHGLKVRADLSKTEGSRALYEDIKAGMITQMSFAFRVALDGDEFISQTNTRKINRIAKVYDVSAVSIPANPTTELSARNAVNAIEEVVKIQKQQETEEKRKLAVAKLKLRINLL